MAETVVGLRLAASAVPHPRRRQGSCATPAHHRLAPFRRGRLCARAAVAGPPEVDEDEAMSIDNLCRFFDLNVGKWNGIFYQFDAHGRVQQEISTRLSASTYGEGNLISLMQSLYIKQTSSEITFVDEEDSEPEWAEYKIKETNMFTVDKYQQIGFFPEQKAFALRYQTVGMLETVLRAGVLGEDDTSEESPKNLKIPSRKPSIVCENCLYSLDGNGRVRAFHIIDPKGVLDTLIVFHENQGSVVPLTDSLTDDPEIPSNDRINALLGRWEGHSVTKRSGVYGATLDEADTVVLLEMDNDGQLIQDNISTKTGTSTTTTIHWTGVANNNLLQFDGGYEITLLPGGMYMGYPSDISKCIEQLDSFHLEFCWMESPGKRQRLVRTFDAAGLAVSSTYFIETKANYAPSSSYQQQTGSFISPLANLNPYQSSSSSYFHVDPPAQWPPRASQPPSSSSLLPRNFAIHHVAPSLYHHDQQMQQLMRAAALGGQHAVVPAAPPIEQPAKDGYNWRKYGQKQLKDAESPRSYYKCTRDGCPVKKIVERSFDGCIKEITYKGRHTHPRPPEPRRGGQAGGDDAAAAAAAAGAEEEEASDDDVLHEDDGQEGHDIGTGAGGAAGQRVVKKHKIILQTPSEVDLLDDGYRWRKYGQKVVKGNPRPRSYYKCTVENCNVRKQIERASTNPRCVLTTYTGRHSHEPPGRGVGATATAGGGGSFSDPMVNPVSGTLHQSSSTHRLKEESRD